MAKTEENEKSRPCDELSDPKNWDWNLDDSNGPVIIDWIDDNDGCGPRKLSRPIKCF